MNLYLKGGTLLSPDVFENSRKRSLEICQLDHEKFLPVPILAWKAALRKIKVKLELLTDNDMLFMVEKGTRGKICHYLNRYEKYNNINI